MINKATEDSFELLNLSSENKSVITSKLLKNSLDKYIMLNNDDSKICSHKILSTVPNGLMFHHAYFEIRLFSQTSLTINVYNNTCLYQTNDKI